MWYKNVENDYFNWLCDLACGPNMAKISMYSQLLKHLDNTQFIYLIDLDGNRASDGVALRYQFGYERKYTKQNIEKYLDNHPCSVLEMMIALAVRIEEQIMSNSDFGDRTNMWFWNMIKSLGLGGMSDSRFDYSLVDEVMDNFLNRKYSAKGEGSLFIVKHPLRDMRRTEIWYQMCWYLNDLDEVKNHYDS